MRIPSGFDFNIVRVIGEDLEQIGENGNLINRFSRRGVENMKVIEVESQFCLLFGMHSPSSLAFSDYLQTSGVKVHIGFAA